MPTVAGVAVAGWKPFWFSHLALLTDGTGLLLLLSVVTSEEQQGIRRPASEPPHVVGTTTRSREARV